MEIIKMKKTLLVFLITLPFLNAGDLIVKISELNVNDTISKIEKIVESKEGLGVFSIINHQAGAKKVNLEIDETKVILFGNPKLGTMIMKKDPMTALDLPLKVLVYQDGNETKIVYRNPLEWKKGFNLEDCKMINKINNCFWWYFGMVCV